MSNDREQRFRSVSGLVRLNTATALTVLLLLTPGSPSALFGQQHDKPLVDVDTSLGTFTIELEPDKAPATVQNFLSYVDAGFYDGTIFHRVMSGFMVQGGGFDPEFNKKNTQTPVENEADRALSNMRGTIAMARLSGKPHSATAQFFVNVVDNLRLDHERKHIGAWGYTAFGRVTSGMEVVDRIAGASTSRQGQHQHAPTTPIVIKSIRRTVQEQQKRSE